MKYKFSTLERWAIYEGYDHKCIYCGELVKFPEMEVDHIITETLLREPERFRRTIYDYGLTANFTINGFQNWACSHRKCNRDKSYILLDKNRALHFLMIAEKKAEKAEKVYKLWKRRDAATKVLAPLRALIEDGTISRYDLIEFADFVIENADLGENNPTLITFGLTLEDVFRSFPKDAPEEVPYLYDWLEDKLTNDLGKQLECPIEMIEEGRDGETLSIRYALWDLDYNKLNHLMIDWWEILEISTYVDIYGEFVSTNN